MLLTVLYIYFLSSFLFAICLYLITKYDLQSFQHNCYLFYWEYSRIGKPRSPKGITYYGLIDTWSLLGSFCALYNLFYLMKIYQRVALLTVWSLLGGSL